MRSSKSRSRSKQNRPRTLGNIINRVFDSSGPEGKVRGTPQQIIEKYQLLARDAQLSNDRVAAENFLQHAEHYTRLLAEAQREMQAEQEARQQYHQQNQGGQSGGGQANANGGQQGNSNGNSNGGQNAGQNGGQNRDRPNGERDYRTERESRSDDAGDEQPYVSNTAAFDVVGDEDAGLVELPEFARPPRRDQGPDRQKPERGDRPRSDNYRAKPQTDRRPDQRNETRNEAPHEPRFVEQPIVNEPVAAVPVPNVAPDAAPKSKPRVRKPVAKVETPSAE